MNEAFTRTEAMLGKDALEKLKNSRVAVFGIGGVGGYACEALARSGVGTIDLIDSDVVSVTNINRQIIASTKTVGEYKVNVMAQRIKEINPDAKVNTHKLFYMPETAGTIDLACYDYIIDAIDTVTGKIELIKNASAQGVKIISSMGTGNKLDPTKFEVADIYKTSVCPLAKVMRRELKNLGIKKLKVVYSKEEAIKCVADENAGRHAPASNSFVPPVAGFILAGEVIKELIK